MRLTIRKKLLVGFFTILVLLGIVGVVGNYQLRNLNEEYKTLIDNRVTKLILAKDMKQEITNQNLAVSEFVTNSDKKNIEKFNRSTETFEEMVNELKHSSKSKRGKEIASSIETAHKSFSTIITQAFKRKESEDMTGFNSIINTDVPQINRDLNDALLNLEIYQKEQMKLASDIATKKVRQSEIISLVILGSAILIGIGLALLISAPITKSVQTFVRTLKQVASGNLSVEEIHIKSRDEMNVLGNAFNHMVKDLRGVVAQVRDSSAQVAASSEQLSASAQQSSSASEEIAQLVEQSAQGTEQQLRHFIQVEKSVQEMTQGIKKITDHSKQMLESAESANTMTKEGSDTLKRVVSQMNMINDSVRESSKIIQSLGTSSAEIYKIVGFITEIAEQTNLLALNAAIEAARAGEHGKGFAVVAEEVRKLAVQSAKSAGQINDMIAKIQQDTKDAIVSMNKQNEEVDSGLKYTKEASTSFSHIEGSIGEVTYKVEEVTASIQQIHALNSIITDAIRTVQKIAETNVAATQQVSAGTEENVATIEEVSASAQSLSELSQDLQKLVSRFNVES